MPTLVVVNWRIYLNKMKLGRNNLFQKQIIPREVFLIDEINKRNTSA